MESQENLLQNAASAPGLTVGTPEAICGATVTINIQRKRSCVAGFCSYIKRKVCAAEFMREITRA